MSAAPAETGTPTGLCECGCGGRTSIAPKTVRTRGLVKGQPMRFISGHHLRVLPRPEPDGEPHKLILPVEPMATVAPLAQAARTRYALRLLDAAELLVGAVRDEGPDAAVARVDAALAIPAPPGVNPVVALAVVLAAQIDVDAPRSRRVGWAERYVR